MGQEQRRDYPLRKVFLCWHELKLWTADATRGLCRRPEPGHNAGPSRDLPVAVSDVRPLSGRESAGEPEAAKEVLPLVSLGPSGIGGPYQREIRPRRTARQAGEKSVCRTRWKE